jgi:hypothetical protein
MQEFSNLLERNKGMEKEELGKFELRKVERDSEGKERYIKTDEDDAIFQTKIKMMGEAAQEELKDATFEERYQWIVKKKSEGNDAYKAGKNQEAIDLYISSLCGLSFKKNITKEQKKDVDMGLKVPVLNNLALCLIQQRNFTRAIQMLD